MNKQNRSNSIVIAVVTILVMTILSYMGCAVALDSWPLSSENTRDFLMIGLISGILLSFLLVLLYRFSKKRKWLIVLSVGIPGGIIFYVGIFMFVSAVASV